MDGLRRRVPFGVGPIICERTYDQLDSARQSGRRYYSSRSARHVAELVDRAPVIHQGRRIRLEMSGRYARSVEIEEIYLSEPSVGMSRPLT